MIALSRSLLGPRNVRWVRYLSAPPLDELKIKIDSYGNEEFPIAALASIRPSPDGEGWLLTPYDDHINRDFRTKLNSEVARIDMNVLYDRKSNKIKLLPNSPKKPEEKILMIEELEHYTPQSSKLMKRLSKRWVPVAKANADEARQNRRKAMATGKRQQPARAAAEEFGMNAVLVERFERIATSNKKALRQLVKQMAAKWDPEVEGWKPSNLPAA